MSVNHDDFIDDDGLRQNNIDELSKGITDLVIHNESRLSLMRNKSGEWSELEMEMMSLKLDIIIEALAGLVSPDAEMQMLDFGINFQVRLAQHLDHLFPDTAPGGGSRNGNTPGAPTPEGE